jgi:hypothetical protein
MGAALFLTGLASLGACAYAETSAGAAGTIESPAPARGYPDLRSVPQTHLANTDQTHWNAVATDVLGAATAMRANDRASFGEPAEDPAIFLDEARKDLTETRDSH